MKKKHTYEYTDDLVNCLDLMYMLNITVLCNELVKSVDKVDLSHNET